ncbi:hypothetical protein HNO88_001453 [Novosphingobium chloroacetimidivorans]|uniref:Glycosyltransferase RgtA/B/C/D-like domain-containing protein n=1 Tax=Novosphingobium chloroacetimidivorans TaxID=1428314 RepID=A0A7W7NW77_9SPHN|nr:hypothetical protein [Novosphingobium chloroacetimidivorans]MBB4858139.1 hypothetical protein [Novosphingobium chloroacetimidivorans]
MSSAKATIAPLRGRQNLLFLLGLLLLWPALLHGDVFGFNDTVSYLRGADTVWAKLTGHSDAFFGNATPAGAQAAPAAPPGMVLYGRSLYFGLFLYLGLLAKSFWVPVVLQALAAGAAIVGMVRHFVDPSDERAFARTCLAAFALVAVTPLPFFVCFLMPDLAVGLAIPVAALLLCRWRFERARWRAGLLALLAFAALAHSTAVAVLGLLAVGGFAAAWRVRSRPVGVAATALMATAAIGIGGEALFGLATRLTTGSSPVRPPFLTARLIEDGPARRFLAEHCADTRFVQCRYPVLQPVSAEVFLWEITRPRGGFKALPVADAIRVSQEQGRFALAVLRAYPTETAAGLGRDFLRLAGNLELHDFRPEYLAGRMRADQPFEAMPANTPLPAIDRAISGLTLVLVLGALAAFPWRRSSPPADLRAAVWVVLAAIALNDVICAWLSGPFARYNTRVIWALPLVVLLFRAAAWRSRGAVPRPRASDTPP